MPPSPARLCDSLPLQVTLLQLEKMFGKGKDAKDFIAELIKGDWAALYSTLLLTTCYPDRFISAYGGLEYIRNQHLRPERGGPPTGLVLVLDDPAPFPNVLFIASEPICAGPKCGQSTDVQSTQRGD